MNELAAKALNGVSGHQAPGAGPSPEPAAPSGVTSALKGLGLPALAIVLAAHPLGRRMIANATKIAPKEMAILENSRLPVFLNPLDDKLARRGVAGQVDAGYTALGSEVAELAKHPGASKVRRWDPFTEVQLPEELAQSATGEVRIGNRGSTHPMETLALHELQHAAGGIEKIEKATADPKRLPLFGDYAKGALWHDLQKQPSVGSELVKPAIKDFPDLPHMYAQYRAQGADAGVALGELLNEYIARVRSGLSREKNMMFGPYSKMANEAFFAPRLKKFMPELEEITANRVPGSNQFEGPLSQMPLGNLNNWDMLVRALKRAQLEEKMKGWVGQDVMQSARRQSR